MDASSIEHVVWGAGAVLLMEVGNVGIIYGPVQLGGRGNRRKEVFRINDR
jgi:hypothetical protein